jgi:hypothetical protein
MKRFVSYPGGLQTDSHKQVQQNVYKCAAADVLNTSRWFCTNYGGWERLRVKEFPWSTFLLEKLTVANIVKKYLAFYASRRSIIVFTRRRRWSLSWPTLIRSITTELIYSMPIEILLSQARLQLSFTSWQGSPSLLLNDLSPCFATNFLLPFSSHAS